MNVQLVDMLGPEQAEAFSERSRQIAEDQVAARLEARRRAGHVGLPQSLGRTSLQPFIAAEARRPEADQQSFDPLLGNYVHNVNPHGPIFY